MERRAGVYTHREHLFGEPARHKVLAHRQVVSQDILSATTHTRTTPSPHVHSQGKLARTHAWWSPPSYPARTQPLRSLETSSSSSRRGWTHLDLFSGQ
jgi:hypothetical protein